MTEVHSCGSPPFSTCLGAVASFIISQGQKCHKKPFPLVYHQSHKEKSVKQSNQEQVRAEQNRQRDAEQNRKLISELKQSVELLKNSNELLQDAISGEIGSLKDEVKENTVQEVRKALQANIEAIQRATKLLEKQSDTLTSVMKQKIRELEESKNSFFRYEGLKLYLFWGGMVCNILVFLMLLYGMLGK